MQSCRNSVHSASPQSLITTVTSSRGEKEREGGRGAASSAGIILICEGETRAGAFVVVVVFLLLLLLFRAGLLSARNECGRGEGKAAAGLGYVSA